MMFSKLAIFFISTAALVSALPGGENVFNSQSGKCNVGKLECCKSVQDAKSEAVQKVLGKLNAAVGDVRGMVGLNCDAISVLGVGTASNCNAQPVCCKGNNFNGLVVIGCSPINVSL